MVALQGLLTSDLYAAALGGLNRYPVVTMSDVRYAVIDAAALGNNEIIPGVSRKKIRVLGFFLAASGSVTVRFESGPDGPALTGQMTMAVNVVQSSKFSPLGWFETAVADPLNMELSDAVSVDGGLVYVLV
jgi:hypothetical protein